MQLGPCLDSKARFNRQTHSSKSMSYPRNDMPRKALWPPAAAAYKSPGLHSSAKCGTHLKCNDRDSSSPSVRPFPHLARGAWTHSHNGACLHGGLHLRRLHLREGTKTVESFLVLGISTTFCPALLMSTANYIQTPKWES